MITLPYSIIPGMSKLFIDYCAGEADIRRYFMGHFTDVMAYETHLQILEQREHPREELCSALARQQEAFGSGEAALANVARLNEPTTFAVLTGQQAGLFLGPMYTIYKALTTVHLARWLGEEFPSYQFVPVFWIEGEDHDLDEANAACVIDRGNDPVKLSWPDNLEPGAKNMRPVGGIAFDDGLTTTRTELLERLGITEFTPALEAMLNASYVPGTTFGTAFARLFNRLFPDHGIIFADPSDPALKRLVRPLILRELETFPTSGEEVIRRSAELEELYHAQIKPRAINLFIRHRGNRYALEPSENDFFLRGSRQRYTREELLAMADETPEVYSPNVALRPVFQDAIFPTVASVAGPGEIAYFAQLQPVYDHFNVPMPVIVPRASISLVDRRVQKLMEKLDLPFTALFDKPDELYRHYLRTSNQKTLVNDYFTMRDDLLALTATFADLAGQIDANLRTPAQAARERIAGVIQQFEEKLVANEKQRDETIERQFQKCANIMMPLDVIQERGLNILSWYNRYGSDVLHAIDTACEPFPAEHRFVML